jgi:predicted dehydrogenase
MQKDLAGGGVLMDLGVHLIDLLVWLLDQNPVKIFCNLSFQKSWEVEDNAEISMEFPDGIKAEVSCSYTHGVDATLRINGDQGWVNLPLTGATEFVFASKTALVGRKDGFQRVLIPERDPFHTTIEHFCEAIITDTPFIVQAREVISTIQVINNCYSFLPLVEDK